MKNMSLVNIANACGAALVAKSDFYNKEISSITINSRNIEKDGLYVALKGARVDGHDFIPQAIEKGAMCVMSEDHLGDVDFPYFIVESTHQALKDMAKFYRQSLDIKVVGVTGSVGKTSTKEMIASVLEQKYNVLKTQGNFNNEIGLPLTIFRLREEHQVAVLEMGISEFGEMSRLTDVAQPDFAVITNIGSCHLEFLGDLDGVLKAKSEIFESMNGQDTFILNAMDEKLASVTQIHGKSPLFFGYKDGNITNLEVYASEVESLGLKGSRPQLYLGSHIITPTISIPGEHMVLNAMAGALVGLKLELSPEEISLGIEALLPVSGRNNIIWGNHYTVIDDCYNANPVSMKASLDVLNTANTRKVAILGDMGELGTEEVSMHKEVGSYASSLDLDVLICIGTLGKHYYEETENSSLQSYYFATKEEFLGQYKDILENGDTILIKSSNFMKFHEIVTNLTI